MNIIEMLKAAKADAYKRSRTYTLDYESVGGDTAVSYGILDHAVELALAESAEKPESLMEPAVVEKQRRVYYQNIVSEVCRQLDRINDRVGHGIVCGTVDAPSTAVKDELKRIVDLILHGKRAIELLRKVYVTPTERYQFGEIGEFLRSFYSGKPPHAPTEKDGRGIELLKRLREALKQGSALSLDYILDLETEVDNFLKQHE